MSGPKVDISKTIVCFLFDGSEKYTRMTLNAVNSFIDATPTVPVGLLFPQNFDASPTLNQINDVSRVAIRNYEQQFSNWNPTQHKLDIQKFADQFESIFWLDSDAIVYKDLTELFQEFNQSPCKVAFLKDHVCWNPQFLNAWSHSHKGEPFIPQACFMGFKRDIIGPFFTEWKKIWREWIEPAPFANFPDPLPNFPGSAFCTEQYALGMVLEGTIVKPADVYVIKRLTFPLRSVPGVAADGVTIKPNAALDIKLSSFSMSEKDISEQEIRLMTTKLSFTSIQGGSFSGSWGSFSGPYVEFSGPSFSFSGYSGPFWESSGQISWGSFSGLEWGSFSTSFSTSFSFPELGSFSSSFTSSGSSAIAGLLSSGSIGLASSGHPGTFWVPVDNIAGGIVHFYSTFYDQSYKWWEQNHDDVIPRLGDYWKEDKH